MWSSSGLITIVVMTLFVGWQVSELVYPEQRFMYALKVASESDSLGHVNFIGMLLANLSDETLSLSWFSSLSSLASAES